MAILVGNKELKNIRELVGEEICIFKFQTKPGERKNEYTLDSSVPMIRIQGKLVGYKFNRRSLTLTAIIKTYRGEKFIEVYPADKYANNQGIWNPVTDNIFGKKVKLQFVNTGTYLKANYVTL